MTTLLCEYAWLGGPTPTPEVVIEVEGDRIVAVAECSAIAYPGGTAEPKVRSSVRLPGLTLPGFANTHSHAFHRALRGRTQSGAGTFWTWRDEMYRVAATLDPDSYFELATSVYQEMRAAGYTVVGEFHYVHHDPTGNRYDDPNAMAEAVIAAAQAAGIRLTLLDTLYMHGGIAAGGYVDPDGVQLRFAESPDAWLQRHVALSPSLAVELGAAVHSVRAVDPQGIAVVSEWAEAANAPIHAHVSEQAAENAQSRSVHGRTPTEVFSDLGVIGDRFTAVHATHLTTDDIDLLGGASATVSLCPTTERDLADGIGPSRRLADAGVRLAVGSDSHAVIDPFEETRAVELNARLDTHRRGIHSVEELLTAATVDGYRSLGWPEGGRIAKDRLADLVTVGLGSVRLDHPPHEHVLASVLFAAHPEDVTHVMVGGRWA